jgi:hypothetical protein
MSRGVITISQINENRRGDNGKKRMESSGKGNNIETRLLLDRADRFSGG